MGADQRQGVDKALRDLPQLRFIFGKGLGQPCQNPLFKTQIVGHHTPLLGQGLNQSLTKGFAGVAVLLVQVLQVPKPCALFALDMATPLKGQLLIGAEPPYSGE